VSKSFQTESIIIKQQQQQQTLVEKQHKGLWWQNSTAPSGRELHHLQFSLQVASLETFGHTLIYKVQLPYYEA